MLKLCYREGLLEAGCDEAGRGCLAGPVFAAAVVLPAGWGHPLLDDSKKMSARSRAALRPVIEREALAWAVASVGPERIDEINILNASFEAMTAAVRGLIEGESGRRGRGRCLPELLLIDGNRFRSPLSIEHVCIVGGDGLYASIAAASVLAKTHRDEYMDSLAASHPAYGWLRNKGYPTAAHRAAIALHGPTPHHRKTFRF